MFGFLEHFLTFVSLAFIGNPFENQRRVRDLCHVVLDTPVYNGHTTAADALWGG